MYHPTAIVPKYDLAAQRWMTSSSTAALARCQPEALKLDGDALGLPVCTRQVDLVIHVSFETKKSPRRIINNDIRGEQLR